MYPLLSPPPIFLYFLKKTLFIAYLRHDKYFKYNLFFAIEKCINTECPDHFPFLPPPDTVTNNALDYCY